MQRLGVTTISPRSIVVLGAGGHAKVIIATIESLGWTVSGVFDDDSALWNTSVLGHTVLGSFAQASENQNRDAVVGIGDNRTRRKIVESYGFRWTTIVHPYSWVAPSAELGSGTVVFAGAVIQPDSRIGSHCIVNTSASIDHDCIVSDFVHLCPGAKLAGGVKVEFGVMIGTGAVVLPYKNIGRLSLIGAGAVVNRDVAAQSTVVGVPAKSSSSEK